MLKNNDVDALLSRLSDQGYEAYLVGGCVRDLLMGRIPHDFDVATAALPEEVIRLFGEERVLLTGLRHGTVSVKTGTQWVEVTTFREEQRYSDHRHPDQVAFTGSLRADLARRDFTINAMARSREGVLIDYFDGRADLQAKTIRCVGNPAARFSEDALRILRALRFAARFCFVVEDATAAALMQQRQWLNEVAKERIFQELSGILTAAGAARVVADFWPVIETVMPALARSAVPKAALVRRVAGVLPERGLRFAALLSGLCAEEAAHTLQALKADRALTEEVQALIREAAIPCLSQRLAVRLCLARLQPRLYFRVLALQRAAADTEEMRATLLQAATLAQTALGEGFCLSARKLAVNGRDLLALGFRGPALGTALRFLLEQVQKEELPNRQDMLLAAAKSILAAQSTQAE